MGVIMRFVLIWCYVNCYNIRVIYIFIKSDFNEFIKILLFFFVEVIN